MRFSYTDGCFFSAAAGTCFTHVKWEFSDILLSGFIGAFSTIFWRWMIHSLSHFYSASVEFSRIYEEGSGYISVEGLNLGLALKSTRRTKRDKWHLRALKFKNNPLLEFPRIFSYMRFVSTVNECINLRLAVHCITKASVYDRKTWLSSESLYRHALNSIFITQRG